MRFVAIKTTSSFLYNIKLYPQLNTKHSVISANPTSHLNTALIKYISLCIFAGGRGAIIPRDNVGEHPSEEHESQNSHWTGLLEAL